ncbi:MAG: L-lactate dehydrogenase [Firmicutes bacterium]|jgi:L-lactate dehydrogenase|nr:L-lactate dehydrogenase [Bacillota bacterium]
MAELGASTGKIVIVGTGFVGATFAYALMIRGLCREIVLIDQNTDRAEGEAMDLNHGIAFAPSALIRTGTYADCAGADIVVITAGAAQQGSESRLELASRNAAVYRQIIPHITRYTDDAILLIVTNPVDVMAYVAYRLSGYPAQRVIGSGTVLDTARFRFLLSRHCQVDVKNVHAYIVGEHGDSEVLLWSLANVAGMKFEQWCLTCEKACDVWEREQIFGNVRDAAYHIIAKKQATYYAIGLALVEICEAVLRDENSVLTISSLLNDYLGVSDVYLSVPVIINREGVARLIELELTPEELQAFQGSAQVVRRTITELAVESLSLA